MIKVEPSVPCRKPGAHFQVGKIPEMEPRGLETEVGGEGGLSLRGSLLLLSAWARNGTFSEEFRSSLGVQRVCGGVSKLSLGVQGFVGCFKTIIGGSRVCGVFQKH